MQESAVHIPIRIPTPSPTPEPTPPATVILKAAIQQHITRVHNARVAKNSRKKKLEKHWKRCVSCKKFIQNAQWISHINGSDRLKAVRRKIDGLNKPTCKECDRQFPSKNDFQTHPLSRGHIQKLRDSDNAIVIE